MAEDLTQLSDTELEARAASNPLIGKPDWTPSDSPEETQRRAADFLETHSLGKRSWEETHAHFQQRFPGMTLPETLKDDFPKMGERGQRMAKLEEARKTGRNIDEDLPGGQYLRKSIPFASTGAGLALDWAYGRAVKRIKDGGATEADYRMVADYEKTQEADKQRGEGIGGGIAEAAKRLPAMVGEFALMAPIGAGKTVAEGAAVAAPKFLSWAGLKAAAGTAAKETLTPAGLGRTALTTALVPSMYADHWTKGNLAAGRDALDVRGLPGAYALGVTQMTVLKGIGGLTAPAFPNSGLAQAAGRVGSQAASGPVAQAAADVLTSAVGLDTGYGTIGQLARGDPEGAIRNATVQAFTFAAFGLAHEMGGAKRPPGTPDPVLAEYQQALQQFARKGVSKNDAGKALLQPADILAALHERNPNPSRAEVAAAMGTLPEGPAREWGMAIAKTIPVQPPAVPVPPPEKPPEAPPKAAEPEAAPESPKTAKRLSEADAAEIFGPRMEETPPAPEKPPAPTEQPEGRREWFGQAPDESGPGKITSDIDPVREALGMGPTVKEVPVETPTPRVEAAPPIAEKIEPKTWTPEEIAKLEKASPAQLEAAADALLKESGFQHSDLDIPVDLDRAIDEGGLPANDAKALKTLLATSSTREAGRRLGVSHEAVRKRAAKALTRLRDADPDRWEGIETAEDLVERGRQQQEQFLKERQAAGALEAMPSDQARSEIGKMMREIRQMDDPAQVEKELAAAHEELRDAIADSRRGPEQPAPVRPEDTARVQGQDEGRGAPVEAPRSVVQGQRAAENTPAPGQAPEAAGNVVGGDLFGSKPEPAPQQGLFGAEAYLPKGKDYWRAEAEKAGIDPEEVFTKAGEIMATENQKTGAWNAALTEARSQLGNLGKVIHFEQYRDWTHLPKFDEVSDSIEKHWPMLAKPGEKFADTLFQMLKQGKRWSIERNEAHQQALDYLTEAKHATEEALRRGESKQAAEEALRAGWEDEAGRNEPAEREPSIDDSNEIYVADEVAPGVHFFRGPGQRGGGQPGGPVPGGGGGQPVAPPRPGGLIDDVKKALAPGGRGPEAEKGAGVIRQNVAEMVRRQEIANRLLEAGQRHFQVEQASKTPAEARINFLQFADAVEAGDIASLPETPLKTDFLGRIGQALTGRKPMTLRELGEAMRDQFDQREQMLLDRDILHSTVENYFGHLWKKPGSNMTSEQIGAALAGRKPLAGREEFKKQRTFATWREGMDAGFEPASWNPLEMALAKMNSIDKAIMGHDVVAELKNQGLWEFRRLGKDAPEGWAKLDDKASTVFAPPEAKVREYYDKNQMEGLERFARSLGINVQTAMTGPPGRSDPNGVVRRFGTPEEILAHEIGHQIADRYGMNNWVADPAIQREMQALGDLRASGRVSPQYQAYIRSGPEAAANLIAARLHAPELLQQVAPTAAARLETLLSSRPELQGLRDIKPSMELGQRDQMMRLAGPMLTGNYWTPEPVHRLLTNYLQPGLRGTPNQPNRLYEIPREVGNVMNLFQLGFSAFHAGFVAMDTQVSAVALAVQQGLRGQFPEAAKSLIGAPTAPFRQWLQGSKVMQEYFNPGSQGAEAAAIVEHLMEAGGRAQMDAFYKNTHIERLRKAMIEVAGGERGKAQALGLANAPLAVAEAVSKPILESLVPRMKLGVFADMARAEMERLGPGADANAKRAAMGKAWDSVENRLGLMTYDNIFWNKTGKDLAMVMIRSVGWNVGTWRELGGGTKDLFSGEGRGPRTAYMIALPVVTAFYGAIYQYLATGKSPDELKDYFFPKTGGTRRDGAPERVSLPSYMRDVYALGNRYDEGPDRILSNAYHMAKHKVHPLAATVAEMLENEDYYGPAIKNPNDPWTRRYMDMGAHLGKAFAPFAVRGYRQQRESGSGVGQASQNFVGITPAPAYVARSFEQQRQMEAGRKIQLTPIEKKRRQDAGK